MKKKVILFFVIVIVILLGINFITNKKPSTTILKEPKTILKADNYILLDKATSLQKKEFKKLKDIVENENSKDEDLVSAISINFLLEYYNFSNISGKEVNGTQYVPNELVERFKTFGKKIYNFYDYNNVKELEIVDIDVVEMSKINYNFIDDLKEINDRKNLNGYELELKWKYKNNNYNNTVITIVKWDDNYCVIKLENQF